MTPHLSSTPLKQNRVIRVASSTYLMIGFIAALPFFAGVGLLAEGEVVFGVLCLALSIGTFYHFCFQKIVFHAAVMSFRRPLLGEKRVDLARVSRVVIALESVGEGFMWRCRIFDGAGLLCEFNPKLFSFAGLDAMFAEIRTYAPSVVIDDGTVGVRPKKKPNQSSEPTAMSVTPPAAQEPRQP
jgi:hypothetical protein